ncbi:hypothetical protein FRC17_009389 [Serendipita sp. 399]|nr:hypothetical protein FRC17_009389 [Serendipita sp. 399]
MTTRMDESFSSFEHGGAFDAAVLTAQAGWANATMRMTMDDVDLVDLDLGHLCHQQQQYVIGQDHMAPGFLGFGARGGPLSPAPAPPISTHSASSSVSTAASSSSSSLFSTSSRASPSLVPTTPALYWVYDVGSEPKSSGMPIPMSMPMSTMTANTTTLSYPYPPQLSDPSPFLYRRRQPHDHFFLYDQPPLPSSTLAPIS